MGTGAAILIGVPIGLLTAVFLSEMAGKRLGTVVGSAVELLAAIPSVIYGLIQGQLSIDLDELLELFKQTYD